MTVRKNLYYSDEAARLMYEYIENQRKLGRKISESDVASQAVVQYCLAAQSNYGEQRTEEVIERLLLKQFNRLASMIASVGIDVDMLLADTLEQRAADYPNVPPKQIKEDLRKSGVELFKGKDSFRIELAGE